MLKIVKAVHTIIWAVMASAIFYTLYAGILDIKNNFLWFSIGLIIFEGVVLLINKGTCPLTPIARKYSSEMSDNFDIYLPNWLARYNKIIFSTIFIFGLLLIFLRNI